ncbi:MAG: HPr kinase/phosphatase C-terminal domain-containing protein [Rhodospirillaceae bacterium]|nr:HPr kinase/phosphatase C-terminal domain-containing protein [Rhodospirillaceae bacterium]
MDTIHATCVALDGRGVVLRGPSGSGKSDLALRLIDGGAVLVADDRVIVTVDGGRVRAHAPDPLRGLLEVRGIGPVRVNTAPAADVVLVVDLTPGQCRERLPEPEFARFGPVAVPCLRLDPFQASAAAKVRIAIAAIPPAGGRMEVVEVAAAQSEEASDG